MTPINRSLLRFLNPPSLPPIRACLFDMDGLLIDSEDLYTICANEVLREYGRPDLPWSIKAQLQGRPAPEVRLSSSPLTLRSFLPPQKMLIFAGPTNLSRLGPAAAYPHRVLR